MSRSITETAFFKKHTNITGSAKNYAKAMLLANAKESDILKTINPMIMTANKPINSNTLLCPSCNSVMAMVTLYKNRKAIYCKNDRVCLPFPK